MAFNITRSHNKGNSHSNLRLRPDLLGLSALASSHQLKQQLGRPQTQVNLILVRKVRGGLRGRLQLRRTLDRDLLYPVPRRRYLNHHLKPNLVPNRGRKLRPKCLDRIIPHNLNTRTPTLNLNNNLKRLLRILPPSRRVWAQILGPVHSSIRLSDQRKAQHLLSTARQLGRFNNKARPKTFRQQHHARQVRQFHRHSKRLSRLRSSRGNIRHNASLCRSRLMEHHNLPMVQMRLFQGQGLWQLNKIRR